MQKSFVPCPCARALFLCAVCVWFSTPFAGLHSQRVTRINPAHITLRGISACGPYNLIAVGDSATILVVTGTDSIFNLFSHRVDAHIDRSITLMAVSYIDSLHGIVGGTSGTIAWTSDAGDRWQESDSKTSGAIRSLGYNDVGAVIGVGDGGTIIRSTDSGRSWAQVSNTSTAQLNAVTFGSPNAGTIVGNDSVILRTTDAGQTWTRFNNPYDFSSDVLNVSKYLTSGIDYAAVAMGGADTMWVTLRKPVFVMKFIRGGIDTSLKLLSNNLILNSGPATALIHSGVPRVEVSLYADDDRVYGQIPGVRWVSNPVMRSGDADGNTNFAAFRFYGASCWPVHGGFDRDRRHTKDSLHIEFLCGENGTLIQFNGGYSSTGNPFNFAPVLFSLASAFAPALHPNDPSAKFGYLVGVGGEIWTTEDGGITWGSKYSSRTESMNAAYAVDSITAIVIGWNGLILRTSNGGAKWDSLWSHTNEKLHGIAFPTPSKGIIVGDNCTILRSTDTARTWSSNGIVKDQSPQKFLYAVDFTSPTTGVAAGESATMYRTTDAGVHWTTINTVESVANDYRQLQAFADGTIYARASTDLLVSHDAGLNWTQVNSLDGGDTLGFGFYNSQIGIVGQRVTSSALVPDTAFFRYTTDGCSTWSNEFAVPLWNYNRVLFHWLNEHQVLMYGIQGFTELLDLTSSGVRVTELSQSFALRAFPNPSNSHFMTIDYDLDHAGSTTIELWNERGERIQSFVEGVERAGHHATRVAIRPELHGAFIIKVLSGSEANALPIIVE